MRSCLFVCPSYFLFCDGRSGNFFSVANRTGALNATRAHTHAQGRPSSILPESFVQGVCCETVNDEGGLRSPSAFKCIGPVLRSFLQNYRTQTPSELCICWTQRPVALLPHTPLNPKQRGFSPHACTFYLHCCCHVANAQTHVAQACMV